MDEFFQSQPSTSAGQMDTTESNQSPNLFLDMIPESSTTIRGNESIESIIPDHLYYRDAITSHATVKELDDNFSDITSVSTELSDLTPLMVMTLPGVTQDPAGPEVTQLDIMQQSMLLAQYPECQVLTVPAPQQDKKSLLEKALRKEQREKQAEQNENNRKNCPRQTTASIVRLFVSTYRVH